MNLKQESSPILSAEMRQYIKYKVSETETKTSKLNIMDSCKSISECKSGGQLRSHLMKDEIGYLPAFFRKYCCNNLPEIHTTVEFTRN